MVAVKRDGADAVATAARETECGGDAKRLKGGEAQAPSVPRTRVEVRAVVRESHNQPVVCVAYNRTAAAAGSGRDVDGEPLGEFENLFATVGSDQATIYDGRHFGKHVALVVHYAQPRREGSEESCGASLTTCAWLDGRALEEEHQRHPNGDALLAVGDEDGRILIISVSEAAVTRALPPDPTADGACGHACAVTHLAAHPTRPYLLLSLSQRDGIAKLWDVRHERCIATFALKTGKAGPRSVAWDPSGTWFASGGSDGAILRWPVAPSLLAPSLGTDALAPAGHPESPTPLRLGITGHNKGKAVDSLHFLGGRGSEPAFLLSKSVDGAIVLSSLTNAAQGGPGDAETAASWRIPTKGFGGAEHTCNVDVSRDAQHFAIGSREGEVRVYSTGLNLARNAKEGDAEGEGQGTGQARVKKSAQASPVAVLEPYAKWVRSQGRREGAAAVHCCAIRGNPMCIGGGEVLSALGDGFLFRHEPRLVAPQDAPAESAEADEKKE